MTTRLNRLFLLALLAMILAFKAHAQTPAQTCIESEPETGNLDGQVLETGKGCDVMLSPNIPNGQALRRYSFSERGVIQIFNQYADDTNGSRTFFVFPRKMIPTLSLPNANEMKVTTSAGDVVLFDATSNPPHVLDQATVSFRLIENPVISKTNSGGVEIVQNSTSQTLVLDSGFLMGGAAFTHPNLSSTFHDVFGNHCTLVNNELFTFADDDADLKFNDSQLFAFLKTACPNLKLPVR